MENETPTCRNCKSAVGDSAVYCYNCNFPIRGTKREQSLFLDKQISQKCDVEESIGKLNRAKYLLFGLGAFYIILPFTPLLQDPTTSTIIVSLVFGAAFIGFGLLTFRKPVIALLIPLVLVILYYLLLLAFSPDYLLVGIIWKVAILSILISGSITVRKADAILKENPYLASLMGFKVKRKIESRDDILDAP